MKNRQLLGVVGLFAVLALALVGAAVPQAEAAYRFADFEGRPPLHVFRAAAAKPVGITPAAIKAAYDLQATATKGGTGTIAIIDAYDDPNIESDLAAFDKQYGLAACTTGNGCFTKHKMASSISKNSGWALETSLDVEWAHAIAPTAKILLVEAKTPSGQNLLDAIDYARARKGVVAVSMSWGGAEFSDELSYDSHFAPASATAMTAATGATATASQLAFFASSGDDGAGASWPAASPYVIGVGGTTLTLATTTGKFVRETAWSGSGGGVSAYEKEPAYQTKYKISKANGMRAIPDVAYDADPMTGYPVYETTGSGATAKGAWYTVGGTSAGAPQWAAIQALGTAAHHPISAATLYADKSSTGTIKFFRDITSGTNGDCGYYCDARTHYDYVTGLGAPQTGRF